MEKQPLRWCSVLVCCCWIPTWLWFRSSNTWMRRKLVWIAGVSLMLLWPVTGQQALVDVKEMTLIAGEGCAQPTASSLWWEMWPWLGRDRWTKVMHPMTCGASSTATGEGASRPSSLLHNPSPSADMANGVETRRSLQKDHLWAGESAFPLPEGKTQKWKMIFSPLTYIFYLLPFITPHFHGTGQGCLLTPSHTQRVVRPTFSLGTPCSGNNRLWGCFHEQHCQDAKQC